MFNAHEGNNMAPNTALLTPLTEEKRTALPTREAAVHLNRSGQTLRLWAMRGDGPLKPRKINGRLAWPVADIKKLMGVA